MLTQPFLELIWFISFSAVANKIGKSKTDPPFLLPLEKIIEKLDRTNMNFNYHLQTAQKAKQNMKIRYQRQFSNDWQNIRF